MEVVVIALSTIALVLGALPYTGSSAARISEERLMAHVQMLSVTIGPRPAGSENAARTADYIAKEFTSYGYQVRFQPFTFNASPNRKVLATTDRNVIASKTGRDTTKVLVVGAHYDSVENSPGADDNASGTAVLLEVARILASRTPDIAVELVAFGAEEDGLIGSLAYVLHNKGRRIVGMVNIDMAGVGEFIWIANDQGPNYLTALALDAAKKLGIAATQERSASSDHVSFETMGIPVVFFNRPENDNIHSPKDAFDKVVPRFVRDMAQIALAVVEWHYQKQ